MQAPITKWIDSVRTGDTGDPQTGFDPSGVGQSDGRLRASERLSREQLYGFVAAKLAMSFGLQYGLKVLRCGDLR